MDGKMARKPTDYVQFKLRIREALRRKLERGAELRKHSANAEAVWRIERTFTQDEAIEAQAEEMEAREAELREMWEKKVQEETQREAEYRTALRDSQLLTRMAGSDEIARMLRFIVRQFGDAHRGWAANPEGRKALADQIHDFILHIDQVREV
jgi:hypothetical protein